MKVLLFLIIILLGGCSNEKPVNDNNVYTPIESKKIEVIEPKYEDDNPLKIGLYLKNSEKRYRVDTYNSDWISLKDINNFTVFYTDENTISRSTLKTVWKSYYGKYDDISNYKIGYHIHFALQNGEIIDRNILSPKDTEGYAYYLMLFLYDDINSSGYYTHLNESDIKDNTIITSVKLTSGNGIKDVLEPITLSAFTYDSVDDFDDLGVYRGNSFTKVDIYRK